MAMSSLVLYQIDTCPDCVKVRRALAELGIACERVEVDRRDRSEVRRVSGQDSVPVLLDRSTNQALSDPAAIVDHLLETHGRERLERIYPEAAAPGMVRIVARYFDESLARFIDPLDERELRRRLTELDRLLADREYLFGPHSLADVSLYAQLARYPGELPGENLRGWMSRMKARA